MQVIMRCDVNLIDKDSQCRQIQYKFHRIGLFSKMWGTELIVGIVKNMKKYDKLKFS